MKTLLLDKKDIKLLQELEFEGVVILHLKEITANTYRLINMKEEKPR